MRLSAAFCYFCICVLAFHAFPVHAQEMKYELYTIDNGLSQNMVQAVCEDSKGFMWFGTKDGLNRFDGHNFMVYRHEPGDPKSISDNDVTAIHEDQAQNLWVGTKLGGLDLFDRKRGIFFVVEEVAIPGDMAEAKEIEQIKEDAQGDIWVTNYNALFRIHIMVSSSSSVLKGLDI